VTETYLHRTFPSHVRPCATERSDEVRLKTLTLPYLTWLNPTYCLLSLIGVWRQWTYLLVSVQQGFSKTRTLWQKQNYNEHSSVAATRKRFFFLARRCVDSTNIKTSRHIFASAIRVMGAAKWYTASNPPPPNQFLWIDKNTSGKRSLSDFWWLLRFYGWLDFIGAGLNEVWKNYSYRQSLWIGGI